LCQKKQLDPFGHFRQKMYQPVFFWR